MIARGLADDDQFTACFFRYNRGSRERRTNDAIAFPTHDFSYLISTRMKSIVSFGLFLSLLFCCGVVAADHHLKGEKKKDAGKATAIFNGKDLTGWDGDPRLWSVRDGVIHGETTKEVPANGNTFLIYQGAKLKDFELTISFRCTAQNNSGIQYRSKHITDKKARNNSTQLF
ncbi:MAG: DUF1080 domain-containing protein, partial [Planctomycetota bacterium]